MKFKQWWITTRFYKWLQTFQHEVVLLEDKKDLVLSSLKEEVRELGEEAKEAKSWFEKLTEEEKEEWKLKGLTFYNKLTDKNMTEAEENLLKAQQEAQAALGQGITPVEESQVIVPPPVVAEKLPEPTELEKIVSSLKTHLDNLTVLAGISDVAKKLNPTGFSVLATTTITSDLKDGTGIIDIIKKYVTDAEILVENISVLHGFIKKQV